MVFKKRKKVSASYDDPESLFRDLRHRKVEGLLSHQSDILRRYCEDGFEEPNVAIELPTGSGKTLVGLLIAEFRRVTKGERVLFLCPTRQLVSQVCEQADRKYGIKATSFTGKIRDYDPDDKSKYQTAKTIAVATYSSLFNTNPFFDSPELIILDDAHAAENYIAATWSLNVTRKDDEQIYSGLLDIFAHALPISEVQRYRASQNDERGVKWIEKVPTSELFDAIPTLNDFLDEHVQDTDLRYPWSLLRGHLDACHAYICYDNILIRPYIPPSLTHKSFAQATQRVFMSATLGLGGDLERMTGVRSFHRLPMPVGWDKQGVGRRFFMFPEMSLEEEDIAPLVERMVKMAGRALLLVPSQPQANKWTDRFSDVPVFSARDIESSKDQFVSEAHAVAILANRYDGIDLLGDECRLLVIEGLPKAGNLQEVFLMSRMAAATLFNDRIRTRIIQAVGRCTRSATDYAAVCVIGEDFCDWFVLKERRALFHPELQGELIFGVEQASGMSDDEFLENLAVFLEHEDQWDDVDADIREYRDESVQKQIPGQNELSQSASLEVDYQYALWKQDYLRSMDLAQQVAAMLPGDQLKGLRGFWYYLSGAAATLACHQLGDSTYSAKASQQYERAIACIPTVGWLRVLASGSNSSDASDSVELSRLLDANVERIEMLFDSRSYSSPRRFEKDVKEILVGISSNTDSEAFEESHRRLGELIGFVSGNSDSDAAPDPWWVCSGKVCLVSEDKNDSDPKNPVSVRHTRQAASHAKWIKMNLSLSDDAEIFTVMITPAKAIHREVATYAENVSWWHIEDFRKWARSAVDVMRNLRSTFSGPGNTQWRKQVRLELRKHGLDPDAVIKTATRQQLRDLPVG